MHLTLRLHAVSRPKENQLPWNVVRFLQSTITRQSTMKQHKTFTGCTVLNKTKLDTGSVQLMYLMTDSKGKKPKTFTTEEIKLSQFPKSRKKSKVLATEYLVRFASPTCFIEVPFTDLLKIYQAFKVLEFSHVVK